MKTKNNLRRWLRSVLCMTLLLAVLAVGVLAYPGDGGNKNLGNGTEDKIDGQTVLIFTTVEPVGTNYRVGGEVYRVGAAGTSQVYQAEAAQGWVFSHWVTYYQGTAVKEANPKYAYGLGSKYYFSVPGNAEKAFDKTSPTIQINNEWDATGVYYLYAIFRPVIKAESDVGSTVSFSNGEIFYSGTGKVEGNILSGGNTKINIFLGKRVVTKLSLNGTATDAYTVKEEFNGNWVYVELTNVTGPTTVKMESRPFNQMVVFDANLGAGTLANQTFAGGTTQKLTKNTYTREGWEFNGWNTKADGTGTAYTDEQSVTFTPATDGEKITLYAQWKHVAHTGGTATCVDQAVCTVCGASYGDLADHTWGDWTSNGDGTHTRACTVSGCDETESGDCAGGTASCVAKAVCTTCSGEYGELTTHTWGSWTSNGNNTHSRTCTVSGCTEKQTGNCAGGTATCQTKAVCTTCNTAYGNLSTTHVWSKWTSNGNNTHSRTCTVSGCTEKQTANCAGGTATCVTKAVCTTCNTAYGNLKAHTWSKWTSNGNNTHSRSCTVNGCTEKQTTNCSGGTASCYKKAVCIGCGSQYGNLKAHTYGKWTANGNGTHSRTCTVSGCGHKETVNCSGGTATCKKQATCSTCTAAYGNLAAHNYKNGVCTVCGAKDPKYGNPDTSDPTIPAAWMGVAVASGTALLGLIFGRKRRQ